MTRLSKFRRSTVEFLRLATGVPLVTVQRRMSLARVAAAREACRTHPSWPAIFVKGYALVAQDMPVLRQAYFRFPLPHLHQYPFSDAAIAVERTIDGESVVWPLLIHNPEGYAVADISDLLARAKTADLTTLDNFRSAWRIASLPWPLRRLAQFVGYNVVRYRRHYYGTFGLTTVGSTGSELLDLVSPLATSLTYGPLSADGTIDVRIVFDHRVVDAAPIARALALLEQRLNGAIADELSPNRPA
jgi:hypothetical protein